MKSAAIFFVYIFCMPAGIFAADQTLVIVFPFEGPAKIGSHQWLSEGLAISISDQLEGRDVRAMDRSERNKLVENLDLPPSARLSRGSMIRVAQRAGADFIVLGAYSGTEQNLKLSARTLNIKTLKLSGESTANGSVSGLQQLENTLAWSIVSNNGLDKSISREKFQERTRKVSNQAYAYFIQSLDAANESEQLQLLMKAVSGYRDFPEAQFRLGRIYFRKGDCGSAIPHLLLGRSEASTLMESDFMRGTCYLQGDQPLQAIQAFWRLRQGAAAPFEALNNMGVAYLRKGDMTLAANVLTDARNASRSDATVSLNLALVRHIQGNDSAARSILEEACRSNPKNGMLHFVLGVVLKSLGEEEKATLATSKAKSLGTNVEKLQQEDPAKWSRILSNIEGR